MGTKLMAGTARVNITPPVGYHLPGSFEYRLSEAIADDLYANVLVMDDGVEEIALVSIDTLIVPKKFPFPVYETILEKTGIEHTFMVATHTHTGVSMGKESHIDEPYTDFYDGFTDRVWNDIVEAVCEARRKKQNAQMGACSRNNKEFLHNRRFEGPDGMVYCLRANIENEKQMM